jgi:hypothetical protein
VARAAVRALSASVAIWALTGCGSTAEPGSLDGSVLDGGGVTDAAPLDGGSPRIDAGHRDAGAAVDAAADEADGGLASDAGAAGDAQILSAYLGLLDGNAAIVARLSLVSGCPQVAGDDAMPVVFSEHLAGDSVAPDDFLVRTAGGRAMRPSCATLSPATGPDERRTVLLTGPLGSASDPPVAVELVGELQATDVDGVETRALSSLFAGEVRRSSEGAALELAIAWRDPARARCADGSVRVQTTWSGGVTARFGREFDARDLSAFRVEGTDAASGAPRSASPVAFADLDDGDNHLDLCVEVGLSPSRVVVEAATAFDPTNNPNPSTSIEVSTR